MASVELPTTPGPVSVAWSPVDFGGTLSGPLGGADQRVNRLGNRWAVQVTMPPMKPSQARIWAADLTKALREGVLWKIRQVGVPVGAPGSPLVAGASQTGATLNVDALTPNYAWKKGQWVSIVTGSRRYLYQFSANGVASNTGTAALVLNPPLRVSPSDNAVVEIGVPYIEGLLVDVPGWSLDPDRIARGFVFSIREAR